MYRELSFLILLICTAKVLSLSCPGPCVRADCDPTRGVGCTAGVHRDVCGCCDTCAKDLGEVCGGPWGTSGTCGDGLTCLKDVHAQIPGADFNAEGKCIRVDLTKCDEKGEPRFCAFDQITTCGSNGAIYDSSCEFASAQCKNPNLSQINCNGPPPPGPSCVEGRTWQDDCNSCFCANGVPACTLQLCPGPSCVEGSTWKDDCNTCTCSNGVPACTVKHCAKPLPAPTCAAPGSGCAGGVCKERCDYENGEYNAPFNSCGGSSCTCCVAAATCHGNGNPCVGGGTCRGECEPGEVEKGFCNVRVADVAQCLCCRKVGIEFTLDFDRFILLDEHKGVTWEQARNLCTEYGYDLAQPQVDITRLASYLLSSPEFADHQYYWLGGKGVGSSINWLSGVEVPPRSALWRKAEQGFQSSTDFCMYLREDGNPNPLGVFNCKDTTYLTPLCEAKPLPPAAPPANAPQVPITFS